MDGAAGTGLVLAGRIREGIRLLREVIAASEANGDAIRATLIRITLAEIYLEILAGGRPAQHVGPLALLKILIVLEEMSDLLLNHCSGAFCRPHERTGRAGGLLRARASALILLLISWQPW
jgi:hypothetical protein